jgi:hypothetical protein
MIYLILSFVALAFSVFILARSLIKKNSIISNLTADKIALKKYISETEAQIADTQRVRDALKNGDPADRFAHSLDVLRDATGNSAGGADKDSVADAPASSSKRKTVR